MLKKGIAVIGILFSSLIFAGSIQGPSYKLGAGAGYKLVVINQPLNKEYQHTIPIYVTFGTEWEYGVNRWFSVKFGPKIAVGPNLIIDHTGGEDSSQIISEGLLDTTLESKLSFKLARGINLNTGLEIGAGLNFDKGKIENIGIYRAKIGMSINQVDFDLFAEFGRAYGGFEVLYRF